jgi:hypothetical protein
MNKALLMLLLLLSPLALRADEAAMEDKDIYYAPDVAEDAAAGTPTASVALPQGAYVSKARLSVFDFSSGKDLKGAELFLGQDYLGRSPLVLQGLVVSPGAELAARLDGYGEASRRALRLPAEGEVRLALLSENPAGWYTTPAWVVGLGLLAASVAVYRSDNTSPGLALVGAGVGVISLSQLTARFFHVPALRREVEDYNARPEAAPAP